MYFGQRTDLIRSQDTTSNSESTPNFEQLFCAPDFSFKVLLERPNISSEIKLASTQTTRLLLERPLLVKDLIKMALQPPRDDSVPTKFPFLALEILCGQEEAFFDYLLGKEAPTAGEDIELNVEGPQLLELAFQMLATSECIDETAAGYLLKILTQISYQKGQEVLLVSIQLFLFIFSRGHIVQRLSEHGYNQSVNDIITKLLTIDSEAVAEFKPSLLCSYIKAQLSRTEEQRLADRVSCLNLLVQELVQRSESKYDGEKYKELVKILHNPSMLTDFKHAGLKQTSPVVAKEVLDIMLSLLRPERQLKIRKELIIKTHKEEILTETPSISEAEAALMVWFLSDLQSWLFPPTTASTSICTDCSDIGPAKLKWLQLLRDLLYLKPEPALKLVDAGSIRRMIEHIVHHPLNNILHNIVRDVLVYAVREGDALAACDKSCKLLEFITASFNSSSKHINQMYHVANALQLKRRSCRKVSSAMRYYREEWTCLVEGKLQEKKLQYERMLAGEDPHRKQSSDYVLFGTKETVEEIASKSEDSEKEVESREVEEEQVKCVWESSFEEVGGQQPTSPKAEQQQAVHTIYSDINFWPHLSLDFKLDDLIQEVEKK